MPMDSFCICARLMWDQSAVFLGVVFCTGQIVNEGVCGVGLLALKYPVKL